MLMIILLMSMLMIWMKHPLSMGLILLIQTINMALYMGYYHLTYWFSYILFLIMVGGMLILFIYMTSVASNEKFYPSMKLMLKSSMILSLWMLIFIFMNPLYINLNNKIENFLLLNKINYSLTKFINFPNHFIYYLLIIYLLIALLIIVKITNFKKSGTLRSSKMF
uniref:NADH-ubiquinone oxidoreductase chain 6 n=1 Tax=Helictopleurus quadripunctatus TaxID=206880 RepID=A0A1X9HF00_9SCAR|nr:NADH deshydrogenase subunit 6 [Helictopleurus quadripunctatus]